MADLQSRYVNIKCNISRCNVDPQAVADWIRSVPPEGYTGDGSDYGNWPGASCFWAVHDEAGKEKHFHMVVRFPYTLRWAKLRNYLKKLDSHHYSQPARAFNRSVRYLLHLDNPEKEPIPREALCVTDNVDDSELAMMLGAPRVSILHDIRSLPACETFRAFDYLVNERGHSPNEVAQVLRCLGTIADWIKRVQADEVLRQEIQSVPDSGFDPFAEKEDFAETPDFTGCDF